MSEPVKVLPMAQLLRLAREKEAREREADAVTAEAPPEPPAAATITTLQETIVSSTIPQQTIVEPHRLVETIVRQTIVPNEETLPSQTTEVSQTIVTGNTNKNNNKDDLKTHTQTSGVRVGSRYTLEECRRFAESLRAEGIQNPGGYATAIHRSGEADGRIETFLEGQENSGVAEKPALSAEQIQEQANVAASMLQHGSSIEEVEQMLASNFRPSQWHMIRSVALAQAKISAPSVKPGKPAR